MNFEVHELFFPLEELETILSDYNFEYEIEVLPASKDYKYDLTNRYNVIIKTNEDYILFKLHEKEIRDRIQKKALELLGDDDFVSAGYYDENEFINDVQKNTQDPLYKKEKK